MLGLKTLGSDLMAASGRLFRRRPPIVDAGNLVDFIDEQSAFVAQKGVYEYSRARAGHYAKILFAEQVFVDAVDKSRWLGFPIGLANARRSAGSYSPSSTAIRHPRPWARTPGATRGASCSCGCSRSADIRSGAPSRSPIHSRGPTWT